MGEQAQATVPDPDPTQAPPAAGSTTPAGAQAPPPSAPTPEQIEAARQVIQGAGLYVLPAEAIASIRGRAEKSAESELAQLRAQIEQLQAGKTETETPAGADDAQAILAQRQAEWDRRQAEAQKQIERLQADLDARTHALQERVVDGALHRILTGAVDPELAATWARAKLGTLETDEAGQLVLTDRAGVTMTGPVAEQAIKDWWKTQTYLHAAAPAGPPAGTGTPAPAGVGFPASPPTGPQHPGEYKPPDGAPLSARLEYAKAYEAKLAEWEKAQESRT